MLNLQQLKQIMENACNEVISKDLDLLKIWAQEESINHRLAVYLENKFWDYKIDCEYNRDWSNTKLDAGNKKFRPDIIIHKRTIEDNLVYIEIKTNDDWRWKVWITEDLQKIKDNQIKYNYQYGVFVLFKNDWLFEIQIFPKIL